MKITRTLLLAVIATVLLAGLTSTVRAQNATTPPAGTTDTAAPADKAPVITEGDRSGNDSTPDTPAKTSEQPTTQPADGPKGPQSLFGNQKMLMIMVGVMIFMFIFMGKGKRKKEAQRKAMLEAIKK
ncbi:MAG: hypothetical protein GY794_11265, partial [bacterium]|nr:hypothetical protein [bacterium]